MKVKESFHRLIDNIEDERLLKSYYALIKRLNQAEPGHLWNSLTKEEQDELMVSYEESYNPANLVKHKTVKEQHGKWLKK